jgi:hypothetical protein
MYLISILTTEGVFVTLNFMYLWQPRTYLKANVNINFHNSLLSSVITLTLVIKSSEVMELYINWLLDRTSLITILGTFIIHS